MSTVFNFEGMNGHVVINEADNPVAISDQAGILKWLGDNPQARSFRVALYPGGEVLPVPIYLKRYSLDEQRNI